MVVEIRPNVVDGHMLKWMIAAGVSWLETHKNQVNNMNVFPVPDGDTGTNMLLTIRNAYQQIATLDEANVGIVSEKIARGALTGARGNSGTILSMLLRGFAKGLQDKSVMDVQAFVAACQSAVDYAYETVRTVMKPVEGTILTVARESVDALQDHAKVESSMRKLFDDMLLAAHDSLENTPNLLPRLKEAGVVDSGGMGLFYILQGMQRLLDGEPVAYDNDDFDLQEHMPLGDWHDAIEPDDEEGYGYDVQFLMLGTDMDVVQVRKDISAMGWSPLIDGDNELIKVHIHVHNPGEPLSYAIAQGVELDDIVVENMQAQYLQYIRDREARETKQVTGVAVIAVGRGEGITRVFRDYGAARIIQGGQTMNPSTEEFLSAINSLETNDIIILPNNSNIIMAARQAASLTTHKQVHVVPSKTPQQGIAAMIAYMDHAEDKIETTFNAMCEMLPTVVSGEVTTATRTVTIDDVKVAEGQHIGMVNSKLVAADNDLLTVIRAILEASDVDEREIVTFYYGAGITEADAQQLVETLAEQYDALEFEIINGEQPLYPYLISIE